MTPITLTMLIFGVMLGLMAVRVPIAISMFAAGCAGYAGFDLGALAVGAYRLAGGEVGVDELGADGCGEFFRQFAGIRGIHLELIGAALAE